MRKKSKVQHAVWNIDTLSCRLEIVCDEMRPPLDTISQPNIRFQADNFAETGRETVRMTSIAP